VVNGTSVALTAIDEDSTPAGVTINSLLSAHFSDANDNQTASGGSAANNFAGVAVTADAANTAQGVWPYSTNNGGSWTDFPAAATIATANALLIAATDQIRFLPAANYNGIPGSLTAHLIDDSAGAITTGGTANLGTTCGSTPYSTGTISIGETPAPARSKTRFCRRRPAAASWRAPTTSSPFAPSKGSTSRSRTAIASA
jgi:hypothetical protein